MNLIFFVFKSYSVVIKPARAHVLITAEGGFATNFDDQIIPTLFPSGARMNLAQQEEAKRLLTEVTAELQRGDLTPEQRADLERHAAALAGALLKPWLPLGLWRRAVMLLLFLLGLLWPFGGGPSWAVAWLVMLLFSPRVVGEMAFVLGRYSTGSKDGRG